MFDDFGRALEASDFADPCDRRRAAHEKDPELEVLVGIESLCVDAELSHKRSPSLGFNLPGHLLELDNHEFGWFERREANDDVDDAQVNVVLGSGFLVTFHEIG